MHGIIDKALALFFKEKVKRIKLIYQTQQPAAEELAGIIAGDSRIIRQQNIIVPPRHFRIEICKKKKYND